jgi:signal transduction histidine kinase/HPt (histidine-containing phosphotransfer) domain-containing protein
MKTGVQFKIAAGYTLAILVLALAVWLVYGNTRAFMQIDKAEREFMERRDVVDSLIYCFLETDNCERSLCLGNTDELDNFDASLRKTMALADSLKAMVSDSSQCLKIDSLRSMLLLKRENTLMIVDEMARNNPDKFFREKVIKLQEGQDSVVIHPKSVEVQENKEVIYDIVKSKKGFFARLADAFRKQHADTIQVSNRSRKAVTDSARHSINIADTVAGVLKEIKREELKARRARQEQLDEKRQTQQLVGVQLARRIEQLLEDIRDEEHRALQAAIDTDLSGRRSVMLKIISLALVAVMSAVVLLLYVRRDMRKARIYNENLERAKAETERIMAQRERLLLTITHDIKAPAASISGFIELLGDYVRDGKAASYLSNIKNSATHLLHLVSALLDYHRLESGKVETRSVSFSPRQLVDSCAEGIRPQAEAKGLAVESDTSGCGSRLCLGDAFRIKQILDNIISNALKYTDQGSIAISARMQGSRLQVDVADRISILIVDDDRLQLQLLREMLTGISGGRWHITACSHADEALRQLADLRPHVFFIDIEMPEMSGTEMAARIAGRYDTLLIAMTAHEPSIEPRLLEAGFDACLFKPFNTDRLCATLQTATGIELDGGKTAAEKADADGCGGTDEDGNGDECRTDKAPDATGDDDGSRTGGHDFRAVTEFAAGDNEACREILSSFMTEIDGHMATLDKAKAGPDRAAISRVAHKALPMLTMIGARSVDELKALSPEHIDSVADADMAEMCERIAGEMRQIRRELDEEIKALG